MSDDASRPSFEELWRQLLPHVRAAVARHPSWDAAIDRDDLLQEVRVRVWTVHEGDRNSRFRPSYYYRVVNSAIIDCLRAHRGTLPNATRAQDDDPARAAERMDSGEESPEDEVEEGLRAERLRSALDRLPASRRRAVALFLQGFTVPEIAELLGCDRNRAHNLTYRGIRSLKKDLGEKND